MAITTSGVLKAIQAVAIALQVAQQMVSAWNQNQNPDPNTQKDIDAQLQDLKVQYDELHRQVQQRLRG